MASKIWNDVLLDRMRMTGDSVADCAAKALWQNKNSKEIIDDLKQISKNHKLILKDFPKEVSDYFEVTENIKIHKGDQELFDKSARIFNDYGFMYCGLLFFKALPTGYMCPKPGHVLERTKLLVNFAARRVMETAQFIFAVNNQNWYKPKSPGLEAIQRVRLMHAGMRIALLNDNRPDRKWNIENYGIPINQEDLALTNHLFSLAMIEGLDEIGIHLFQDEREAIFHTWQHIGQAMGICPELYVEDYSSGLDQYKSIYNRQSNKDNPDGPVLTRALLESIGVMTKVEISLESLEDIVIYFLKDKRSSDSLGMHQPGLSHKIFDAVAHFLTSLKIWQKLFHHKSNSLKQGILFNIINYFVSKRLGLEPELKRYPKTHLMEIVSKTILAGLHNNDLQTYDANRNEHSDKSFFFENSILYEEWGLGGFELDVKDSQVM